MAPGARPTVRRRRVASRLSLSLCWRLWPGRLLRWLGVLVAGELLGVLVADELQGLLRWGAEIGEGGALRAATEIFAP